ncbi:hypothetical protein AOQ72_16190 [Bradyrhizobium yuanmingense]|uniref:Uncharacterized protein n=1 Tax=Bradyrhizobium yuanmingense TaxID=108015 RepID=A0A0R3CMC1_9BRAD|nr:hypothetical protein AOQ72_16190 [Bradyrhizobium yuanmingense]
MPHLADGDQIVRPFLWETLDTAMTQRNVFTADYGSRVVVTVQTTFDDERMLEPSIETPSKKPLSADRQN